MAINTEYISTHDNTFTYDLSREELETWMDKTQEGQCIECPMMDPSTQKQHGQITKLLCDFKKWEDPTDMQTRVIDLSLIHI